MPSRTRLSARISVMSSPSNSIRPLVALLHAGDRAQQRGFAGAVGAYEGNQLLFADDEVDVAQRGDAAIVAAKPANGQERHVRRKR